MSRQEHDPDSLSELIREEWTPPHTDANAFDAGLRAKLLGIRRRRRILLVAAGTTALLAVAALRQGPPPASPLPQAGQQPEPTSTSLWWSDVTPQPVALPGQYQALSALFLEPLETEVP